MMARKGYRLSTLGCFGLLAAAFLGIGTSWYFCQSHLGSMQSLAGTWEKHENGVRQRLILRADGTYQQWIEIASDAPIKNRGVWRIETTRFPSEVWLTSALFPEPDSGESLHVPLHRTNTVLPVECMPWGIELGGGSDTGFRRRSRSTSVR